MSTIAVSGVTGPFNTIILKRLDNTRSYPETEDPATVITKPGMLVERVPTGVRPHTIRGGRAQRRFAIECGLLGKTISQSYAVTDKVLNTIAEPGDWVQAILKQGENVLKADWLISYGDGTLCKAASAYLINNAAASTTVTNTTAETTFSNGTITIPANSLKVGDVLRIRGQVTVPSTNSTDTLSIKVNIAGSTALLTVPALDVANADIVTFDLTLVVRTIGATGTIYGFGWYTTGPSATATAKAFTLASTTVDTTAAASITVTATWSVASTSNQAILQALTAEHVKAGPTAVNGAAAGGDIIGQVINEAVDLSAAVADGWVQVEIL